MAAPAEEFTPGESYYLRNYESGKYLSVDGFSTGDRTNVVQSEFTGRKNMQWNTYETEDGYCVLRPAYSKTLALDLAGSSDPKCNVDVYNTTEEDPYPDWARWKFQKNDGGTNQKWYLEKKAGRMNGISGTVNTSMTYNHWGSYVNTVTDARGNTVQNTYDSNNRLLTEVKDPKGNSVQYSYDPDTDATTQITSSVGEKDVTVGYTYNSVGQLEAITHNGFDYTFEYDAFGNTTATKANGHILSSNSYLPHNGLMSESTYGNGETVGYEYDKYGRVTGKSYNGGTQFTWKYDNLGNQQEHMDRANGVKYVYQYDLIDRMTGVDASNG